MCGLAAMIGPGITQQDLKAINDLAYVTGLRGFHSTGVFQVQKDHKGDLQRQSLDKRALTVADFQYFHSLDPKINKDQGVDNQILNSTLVNLMMVHCRHATLGEINDANAHPFETKRYIGMHNGSLTDRKYTSMMGPDRNKTDSERMFKDMDEHGIGYVLANLDTTSAYAVFIFDKEEKKLYVARNSKRTLYFTSNKERGVAYFSSEIEMLRLALNRRSIKYGDIYYFEPGKLYCFDLVSAGFSYDKDSGWRASFTAEDLPARTQQVTPSWNQADYETRRFDNTFRGFNPPFKQEGTKGTSETKKSGKESKDGKVLNFPNRSGTGLIGIRQSREDKFYCDECSDYVFGHDKDICDKMFQDANTLLCADCMNKHITVNLNHTVLN